MAVVALDVKLDLLFLIIFFFSLSFFFYISAEGVVERIPKKVTLLLENGETEGQQKELERCWR